MGEWVFNRRPDGEVESEITQRDQFANDDVTLAASLVRETVQNSLDAAINGSPSSEAPVRVSFRLNDVDTPTGQGLLESLVDDQIDHARAAGIEEDPEGLFSKPAVLVIEDFNTTGLVGATAQWDNNPFTDFWRRHGRGHKKGTARGRWGLGKIVFSLSSRLGVFFGATIRSGEWIPLVMGQTVLNFHPYEGKIYKPHAFFGETYRPDPEDPDADIVVPIDDEALWKRLSSEFGAIRRDEEPGLTVFVPFPKEGITESAILKEAVENYFYPLMTGELVITVGDRVIDSASIEAIASELEGEIRDISSHLQFVARTGEVPGSRRFRSMVLGPNEELGEDSFKASDLEALREQYGAGEMVAVDVPVLVQPKDGEAAESEVTVYLQATPDFTRGWDLYVRGGVVLSGESHIGDGRANGLLIASGNEISGFLAAAENPAHTKWTGTAEKLAGYKYSQSTLKRSRYALRWLYEILADEDEEIDDTILADILPTPKPAKGGQGGGEDPFTPPDDLPEPTPEPWRVQASEGVISVLPSKALSAESLPLECVARLAYDRARGNPFKRYSILDFDVGGMLATRSGVDIAFAEKNLLQFTITERDFRIEISGFDPNRDVRVKLETVESGEGGEA